VALRDDDVVLGITAGRVVGWHRAIQAEYTAQGDGMRIGSCVARGKFVSHGSHRVTPGRRNRGSVSDQPSGLGQQLPKELMSRGTRRQ
jgi:hypothetical protein